MAERLFFLKKKLKKGVRLALGEWVAGHDPATQACAGQPTGYPQKHTRAKDLWTADHLAQEVREGRRMEVRRSQVVKQVKDSYSAYLQSE